MALGELETLIESSPQEWQNLFQQFQETLKKWADTNLETLKQLAHKAETTERLADNSEKLTNYLEKFLDICTGQMKRMQESDGQLMNSLSHLQTSETELKILVQKSQSELSQLESKIGNLTSTLEAPNPKKVKWIWKDSVLVGAIALSLLTSLFLSWELSQTIQQMSQRVQWLLEKANRQDCLTGIKSQDSSECQGLFDD